MSFSSKVKNEICRYTEMSVEEAYSQISAILKGASTITFGGKERIFVNIASENASTARLTFMLLKQYFNIPTEIIVKKIHYLKKNNIYIVKTRDINGTKELLLKTGLIKDDIDLFSINYSINQPILGSEKLKKAYLRGAFLGSGSISNPDKTYHLEFVVNNEKYANDLSRLINSFKLKSKVIKRKNMSVVYLKGAEEIIHILNLTGAHASLLELENIRIVKETRNHVNRILNCETANLSKTVDTSIRQIESIKLIEKEIGFKRLPKNLRDIALLRVKHPEETLKELGEKLNPPVGKSGVNHRLRKIEKIAEELRNEGI